jgi:hypothetical protein
MSTVVETRVTFRQGLRFAALLWAIMHVPIAMSSGSSVNIDNRSGEHGKTRSKEVSEVPGYIIGKPVAPIHFDVQIMGVPKVGETISLRVAVTTTLSDMPLRVFYRTSDDTQANDARGAREMNLAMNEADAGNSRIMEIDITPVREGRILVRLFAQLDAPYGVISRSQVFAVQVGKSTFVPIVNGRLVQETDGEILISMPSK